MSKTTETELDRLTRRYPNVQFPKSNFSEATMDIEEVAKEMNAALDEQFGVKSDLGRVPQREAMRQFSRDVLDAYDELVGYERLLRLTLSLEWPTRQYQVFSAFYGESTLRVRTYPRKAYEIICTPEIRTIMANNIGAQIKKLKSFLKVNTKVVVDDVEVTIFQDDWFPIEMDHDNPLGELKTR